MNQKIKDIKKQIWAEGYWSNPTTDKLLPLQLQKFANLIIQECIDMIELRANTCADVLDSKKANQYVKDSQRECAKMIKQHFGVK